MTVAAPTSTLTASPSDGDDLPEGWSLVSVADVITLYNGRAFKPSDWQASGFPIVRIQNLNNPRAPFNYSPDPPPARFRVEPGNLVFAWSGTPGTSFGAHIWSGQTGWLNQHIFRVDFHEELLNKSFLRHAINRNLDDYIAQAHGGVGLAHITKGMFESSLLRVPPLAEQHRIVARLESLLAQFTATRDRLDRVRTLLNRFRQSVLAAACSGRLTEDWRSPDDPPTDDGLPANWRCATIAEIASPLPRSIQSGPFGSNLLHSEFQPTGILAIGIDNVLEGVFSLGRQHRISEEKYRALEKYTARPLDVLVTVMATVGRCCVVPSDLELAIITKHVYRITLDQDRADPYYVMYSLRGDPDLQEQIDANIRGQTRPGINGQILKALELRLPPLTEQREIVRRVDALLTLAGSIEQRLSAASTRTNDLTQSSLAKAFRGELVPTEAAIARAQGREYEPASVLLDRLRAARATHLPTSGRDNSSSRELTSSRSKAV
jgi:type I restriction enzyme, S subunit